MKELGSSKDVKFAGVLLHNNKLLPITTVVLLITKVIDNITVVPLIDEIKH